MRLKNLTIAVSMAVFSLSANAIVAMGMVSCGVYISSVEAKNNGSHYSWVAGYLSGVAMGIKVDFVGRTDGPSVRLWLENYCRKNPLKSTADAADDLIMELVKASRQ